MQTSNPKMVFQGLDPRGGGQLPYNSDGDIVVSLWGVNCRFWFQLGCLGWKVTLFAQFRYRLILYMEKFTKNVLTLTTQKSPLGVRLSLSHTHTDLP